MAKFLSTAPVLIMALLTFTAGILIEFNRFYVIPSPRLRKHSR
jgi:photosystem I subunit IX